MKEVKIRVLLEENGQMDGFEKHLECRISGDWERERGKQNDVCVSALSNE